MNLNDKAKSVKLNSRNLRVLQIETVTQESKEIEEKLQQLKRSMSKEKEERGHSGGFKWKSGRCGSMNNKSLKDSAKEDKKNRLQKLSAGKIKIRILKDDPPTAPPQPPPQPPAIGPRTTTTTTTNRLKGPICGQCEVKTAGLNCTECTENYCIGCFARFHQKGALKLHRMIPFQTELETHVSTRDILGYSPSTSSSPSSRPVTRHNVTSSASSRRGGQSPVVGLEAAERPDTSQVSAASRAEEWRFETGSRRGAEKGFPTSLLSGEYNEEESASSFREALRQWRGGTGDGAGDATSDDAMWTPLRPVSAIAIQADLPPDRDAEGEGRGGGKGRIPLRVEFTADNLTYMDRLLLKKHRRVPIQTHDPLLAPRSDVKSQPNGNTEQVEEMSSLTAKEEDFRRYCASLFAVPVSSGRTQTQSTRLEPCLVIEVLDEEDGGINGVFAEQRTNNREVPVFRQVSSDGGASGPRAALTGVGSSGVDLSPHSPTPTKSAQTLHSTKPQTLNGEHSMKSSPSKRSPSPCPTAETTGTLQTSIKTLNSMSQKPTFFPAVPKSKAPRETPNSSCFPLPFPSDVSPTGTRSPLPKEPLSPSPSATFSLSTISTLSPSSSAEVTLSPKVRLPTPLRRLRLDSSPQPEQSQSSNLFPEPISSPKLSQSPQGGNLASPEQSQHSLGDPDSLLSDNQLELPQSSRPNPRPTSLEPRQTQRNPARFSTTVKTLSSSLNESPPEVNSRDKSTPSYGDAAVYTSSTSFPGDHESTQQARGDTECISSLSSHPFNVAQNHPCSVRMEEEELSTDSGDDMSSDSLDLAPHDDGGGSSDDEAQTHGRSTRRRSREGERGIAVASHLGDSFVSAHADVEKDLQTDEPEQLSEEPYTVTHDWSAGSGSERLSGLEGFSPLSVDLNSAHSDTPEHTHLDPLPTRPSPPHDLDATVFYSASKWSGKSSPTLSHRAMATPSPPHSPSPPPPRSACVYRPTSGSELGPAFRPLSRASREIAESRGVDSDLDTTTTKTPMLCSLEQGLTLTAKETGTHQVSSSGEMNSGSRSQHGSQ